MSFTAVFKSVLKRTNSTQVPNMQQDSTTLSVVVLDATSVMTPRIRLSYNGNPTNWNYCMISEFGRYYFITDWTSDHNQWIATLNCDVLATYKQTILASQEYVLRSASSWDGSIIDTAYPAKVDRDFQRMIPRQSYDSDLTYFPLQQGESYIVGIVGMAEKRINTQEFRDFMRQFEMGSVTYYWLSRSELCAVINYLLSADALQNMWQITDISENLQKGIINPLQYIQSITRIPINRVKVPNNIPEGIGNETPSVFYGYFEIDVSTFIDYDPSAVEYFAMWKINDIKNIDCYFRLTEHPYAATRGKYLNFSPWLEYQLTYEPFGNFVIDLKNLEDAVGLQCHIELEGIEGIATLKIYAMEEIPTPGGGSSVQVNPRRLVYYGNAQIGVPIAVSQITQDYVKRIGGDVQGALGMAGSAVGMAASIATGNIPGAVASGIGVASHAASMIGSAVDNMIPNVSTKGANGNIYAFNVDGPWLYCAYTYPVDDDNEQLGRPLCRKVTLSTLSGFCQCSDADIKISGTTSESDAIKDFMNGGFFIE